MQVPISTSPSLHVTATRYQRFVLIALALAGLDIQVCINVAGLVLIMAFGVWKSLAATHHYIPHLVTADLAASRFFGWMLSRTFSLAVSPLQAWYSATMTVLRRMEYLVVDSALGTGLLAGKSNERPIAVLDDFLSAAELQPLLAQLPDNPNEYLHAAMRDGTAKSNDGKGIALQVDVEAAVMRKLRAAMFAGADTELTTAEQTRLPVLISAGDCAEHRDRFVSDSDGYSPDKLVYGYAAFVYLAGGEDSTLFFRHDSGKVESVACTPGRMVVFKNLAVRHWVEGPMEQARVMLGPFAMESREGEIRQITAGSAPGWMFLAIAAILCWPFLCLLYAVLGRDLFLASSMTLLVMRLHGLI